MFCATGKCSRRIEKLLVNCTSSGVLTRIENDLVPASVMRLHASITPQYFHSVTLIALAPFVCWLYSELG